MNLTKQDIRLLIDGGASNEDIIDMILWGDDVKCFIDTPQKKNKRISYKQASQFLGRAQFLFAIHRAMYHRDCAREHISFVNTKWGC